jgi:hypothetical protein
MSEIELFTSFRKSGSATDLRLRNNKALLYGRPLCATLTSSHTLARLLAVMDP